MKRKRKNSFDAARGHRLLVRVFPCKGRTSGESHDIQCNERLPQDGVFERGSGILARDAILTMIVRLLRSLWRKGQLFTGVCLRRKRYDNIM